MKDLSGKTAFITGGAGGIGLAMGRAFGHEGMNVMLADVEEAALQAAVSALKDLGIRAEGVIADVTSPDDMQKAAKRTTETFGRLHLLCNNAGILRAGKVVEFGGADWQPVIDINIHGVVNGMNMLLPLIMAHGEGGHVLNTASILGMFSPPEAEAYSASKYAVVAMSEGWAVQLADKGIGVSVLCPGLVSTPIFEETGNAELANAGLSPDAVAKRVVEAIRADQLYVFTHPEYKGLCEKRFSKILAAFDDAAQSPVLSALPPRDYYNFGME